MTTAMDVELLEADWVVPIVPEGNVHAQWSVAIAGSRIVDIGPRESLRRVYPQAVRTALTGRLLMPGLVNAHGHLAMTLLRGLAEDLPLTTWLEQRIWPLESRWVDGQFVADGAALAIVEMLRTGTTTASDMYFFPERVAALARQAGFRMQIAFPIVGAKTPWASDAADAIRRGLELYDSCRDDDLIQVAFGPHSTYAVATHDLERICTLADELDAPVHIHLHENSAEVSDSRRAHGASPVARLDAIGLLTPRLQAVHMTALDDADLERVRSRGASVVHCPQSNLKLGNGSCPVARLLSAGIRVGLGTDGAASGNDLDLFDELHTAALLGKAVSGDPAALPAATALEMATLGGARALGLDDQIGSIEPGKAADLIALDLTRPGAVPVLNVLALLVHGGAGNLVTHAWIAGRCLLREGELTTLDLHAILDRASHWGRQLSMPAEGASLAR
jgi:5-methylthioadenosine/S-adenosylhomocysteine deaminase